MMMTRISFLLAFSSLFIYRVFAVDIHGRIQWTEVCAGAKDLGPAKVVLDEGRLSGGVVQDGSFVIPDVSPGTYVLSVLSHDYTFDQLRVDIIDSKPEPEVRPYIAGTPLNPLSSVLLGYPITLPVRKKNDYFIPQESFNIVAMFQNPMMVLMVFAGVMVLAMPYIMKNLDPELLQEVKKGQARVAAGATAKSRDDEAGAKPSQGNKTNRGNARNKRRGGM